MAGKPLCTRGGLSARVICFDRKNESSPIVALVETDVNTEIIANYTTDGAYYHSAFNPLSKHPLDLVMEDV